MVRPEDLLPPDLYYSSREARKYTTSSRVRHIQAQMTRRALELLRLPETHPSFILDLGCGSGLSGEILSERLEGDDEEEGRPGHVWVGMDIAPFMLEVALERREGSLRAENTRETDEEQDETELERSPGDDDSDLEEQEEDDDGYDPYGSNPDPARVQGAGGSGDLFLADMGQGLSFRPGTFDAAISISAVQWLCNGRGHRYQT